MAENELRSKTRIQTPPYLLEIVRSDPFARFLQRLGLSAVQFGLIAMVYSAIRDLALPALFGTLFTTEVDGVLILGVLNDWPVLVNELVTVPIIAVYYLWQPRTMQKLYDGISQKIGPDPLARAKAMEYVRPARWRGWAVVAFLIGLLEAIYLLNFYLYGGNIQWQNVNLIMVASSLFIRLVSFYMVVFITIRQAFMIIGLNRLFAETSVMITPLHPDRAGGLHALGEYVLSTSVIIGAIGLYFGMGFVRQGLNPNILTFEFYGWMVIYFLLAPLFLLLPLIQAHRRMREAKHRLLVEVADQFDIEYRKLLAGLKSDQMDATLVQRVEAVQKIYTIAEGAPEWPLNQMAIIDRNILRMAIWEFAVARQTPIKVAINEAVELAKLYGADSAPRFVNGVLGALADREAEFAHLFAHPAR